MDSNGHPEEITTAIRLDQVHFELARRTVTIGLSEAAAAPCWAPHPTSVIGHRPAAGVFRSEADRPLAASRRSRR